MNVITIPRQKTIGACLARCGVEGYGWRYGGRFMRERLYFLDGLRGWTSLAVVFSHLIQGWILNPYWLAANGQSLLLTILTKTPLATLSDGSLAVRIFFVISGFALSYLILTSPDPWRSLINMATFRYLRLAIPIFCSCLLTLALWGSMTNIAADKITDSGWLNNFYHFSPSLAGLFRFAWYDVFFAYPAATDSWNAVLWTMQIELFGSFAVFLGLAIIPFRPIRILTAGIALYAYSSSYYCGFAAGYLIAELAFLNRRRSNALGLLFLASGFGLSLHMHITGSVNDLTYNVTAALFLLGLSLSKAAQQALSGTISRFMGRISFSLYLVHLPIICSVGAGLYFWLWPLMGTLLTTLIVGPVTIATSVAVGLVFNIVVEETAVLLAKRRLSRFIAKTTHDPNPSGAHLANKFPPMDQNSSRQMIAGKNLIFPRLTSFLSSVYS